MSSDEVRFSLGKFLSPPSEGNEPSLFQSWLQNRLREYYLKLDEFNRKAKDEHSFEPVLSIDESEICFSTLKLHHIQEESGTSEESSKGIQCKYDDTNLLYETATRKFTVTLQKNGVNSPIETLHLMLLVGEVHDMGAFDKLYHPFLTYAEKHSIHMFNLVFPALQGWINAKNFDKSLPIPTCYYTGYEEEEKVDLEHFLDTKDDIISKLESALELDKDKRNVVMESHRILILDNVHKLGFKRINASFLSLMNVTCGLKEIAKLHATSWAFSKAINKNLIEQWQFLEMTNFLPYVNSLVAVGFPLLATLSETYLSKHNADDKDQILTLLHLICKNLTNYTNKLYPSNALCSSTENKGPVTLIHQNLNHTTTLFRTNYHHQNAEKGKDPTDLKICIERELCIVDWKCATVGSPMFDVASFLLTSLPPKTRQTETTSLLNLYAHEFEAAAFNLGHYNDICWKWDDLAEDYQKGLLYGCLVLSSNISPDSHVSEDDMEVFVEGIRDVVSLQVL